MGRISGDTLKRLTLLTLISGFVDGVYGNFRLQKVLYFAEKYSGDHIFGFQHTDLGQYSYDVGYYIEQLASLHKIKATPLPESDRGNRYILAPSANPIAYRKAVAKFSGKFNSDLSRSIDEFGYLPWEILKDKAHADPALKEVDYSDWIFPEEIPEYVKIDLTEDECEELELSLNPDFIAAATGLIEAIEGTEFDFEKVKTVESIF